MFQASPEEQNNNQDWRLTDSMDPNVLMTAMLNSITYNNNEHDAHVVPETDFVPFDLSYLRGFSGQGEKVRNPFGGHAQNASDALPA